MSENGGMGWFDEQIHKRKLLDDELFSSALIGMTGAILGDKIAVALKDERLVSKNSIDEILKYYHVHSMDIPSNLKEPGEQIDYLCRPHGIMYRSVKLKEGWSGDAVGPMLGVFKKGGMLTAIIPRNDVGGYAYRDPETGKRRMVLKASEELFEDEAICFYKPFPLRKLGIRDLMMYMAGLLHIPDIVPIVIAMFLVMLIGFIQPKMSHAMFSDVVDSKNLRVLMSAGFFLISVTTSVTLLQAVKSLLFSRINTKVSVNVQAAAMMRVLSLPADFFKDYNSGELSQRMQYINTLSSTLLDMVLSTGLTSVFSLAYITQIYRFAPSLCSTAFAIILITVIFSFVSTLLQINVSRQKMNLSAQESGLTHAIVTGVQKIRLAGAEKRAFSKWALQYAKSVKLDYNPMFFLKINGVISQAITLIGLIVLYYKALESGISVADYNAFSSAYGMVSAAFLSLSGIALKVAQVKPIVEMVEPFLKTVPEISEKKYMVNRLTGSIELSHVSFRYVENMPMVLDDISIKIRPKQYIAIVGKTGCGKSTLMRLLLGFETPQRGSIYYDGRDMSKLDLKTLRKNIGSVMQNGKLFVGSIYENITISAPRLTLDDAWSAAEMAGLADDIRAMPMGMHTIISEGSGGISGGQKQRLLIARAVAPKPNILIFDEATSALDNETQKKVSEALSGLNCTRIVIAHRLSTIKECDRILVLDGGRIIEDGTYDELIEMGGFFADLVDRQRLDK